MTRVLLIIFFCAAINAWGQQTKTSSFGLTNNVASFSLTVDIQTSFNAPHNRIMSKKEYFFNHSGLLHTEIDSIAKSKRVYQYNRKGDCIKIFNYKNDSLDAITYLTRKAGKILFKNERDGLIDFSGYYIVDQFDRIIEFGSFDKGNETSAYKEYIKFDSNSLIKTLIHSKNESSMTREFENVIIATDEYLNWTEYIAKSSDLFARHSIYKRTIRYK